MLSEQPYRKTDATAPGGTSVAVIDDDGSLRSALRSLFQSYGLTVRLFSSAEDFLSAVDFTAECLIIDVRMPGMSGLELQRYLLAHGRRTPAVFISAHDDRVARLEAAEAGALAFLRKPFTADSMMAAVGSALGPDAVERRP